MLSNVYQNSVSVFVCGLYLCVCMFFLSTAVVLRNESRDCGGEEHSNKGVLDGLYRRDNGVGGLNWSGA